MYIALYFLANSCEKEFYSLPEKAKVCVTNSELCNKIKVGVSLGDLSVRNENKDYSNIDEDLKIKIINELIQMDNVVSYLDSFHSYYGLPCWECAILELDGNGGEIASIPFIKNQVVSSVLIFSDFEHRVSMKYLSIEDAHRLYLNEDMHEDFNLPMIRLSSFVINLENRVDTIIGNWINHTAKLSSDSEKGYQIVLDYQYGLESDIATIVSGTMEFIVSCSGGGGGNGWPNSVPSIINVHQDITITNNGGASISSGANLTRSEKIDKIIAELNLFDFEDCLISSDEVVINELENLLSRNLRDPCNQIFRSDDLVQNIILDNCPEINSSETDNMDDGLLNFDSENGISIHAIINEIDKVDFIDMTGIEDNAKLSCLFDKFYATDNNILCDFTSRFFGNSESGNLYINDELPLTDGANARVGYIGNRDIRVRFSKDFINNTCEIGIMRTILHELLHVEYRAVENNPSYDNSSFSVVYQNYMNTNNIDHNIMADNYRNRIIDGLRSIYGSQYNEQEYESLSWGGLGPLYVEPINSPPYYTTDPVTATLAWINLGAAEHQSHFGNIDYLTNNCEGDEENSCD